MNEKQEQLKAAYDNLELANSGMATPEGVERDLDLIYDLALKLLADDLEKNIKDYTLSELADLVHDMAKEKGWWEAPRKWHEMACLIHSEISEAVECYRNGEMALHIVDGKPEGLVVELADVVIRCLDYLAYLEQSYALPEQSLNEWATRQLNSDVDCFYFLNLMHKDIDSDSRTTIERLENCMAAAAWCARRFNLDLPVAIEAKIHYNATRPYRHGGKKA